MRIINQWIIGYTHIIEYENGIYKKGDITSIKCYDIVGEKEALQLINTI